MWGSSSSTTVLYDIMNFESSFVRAIYRNSDTLWVVVTSWNYIYITK